MTFNQQVQKDIQSILGNPNEREPITLTAPTSPLTVANVYGTAKKHHLLFDENGMVKGNVTNATCTISILDLDAINYPYKNANGEVAMQRHTATWSDVSGVPVTYVVNEWYPDQTTGNVVLILGDYAAN